MRNSVMGLTGRQLVIVLLTVATAIIHFSRALIDPDISLLFSLNALGYLALVALLYLPLPQMRRWRRQVGWVLIGYTAVTIVLFFVWGAMSGDWPAIGFVDKLIEAALIWLVWQESRS